MLKWFDGVRNFMSLMFKGQDRDVRAQVERITAEVQRLRENRLKQERQLEQEVLQELRDYLQELKNMESSLVVAEAEAAEFAKDLAELAKKQMEVEEQARADQLHALMKAFKENKELFDGGDMSRMSKVVDLQAEMKQAIAAVADTSDADTSKGSSTDSAVVNEQKL